MFIYRVHKYQKSSYRFIGTGGQAMNGQNLLEWEF